MPTRSKWDDFDDDDSDDEDLRGGKLERADYTVVGENVAVLEAPDTSAGVLDLKEAGMTLPCDAVKGNWVRLRETFDVRGKSDPARGWAMIDGTEMGFGPLLQRKERPAKKIESAQQQPTAAAESKAPTRPQIVHQPLPPEAVPDQTAASSSADPRQQYYNQWDSLVAREVPEDEEADIPFAFRTKRENLYQGLKAMNPQAMHNLGYCWSVLQDGPPPVYKGTRGDDEFS